MVVNFTVHTKGPLHVELISLKGSKNILWNLKVVIHWNLQSPGKARVKAESERGVSRENRRVSHISAEHKRRCNIKYGFDTLHQLVPSLRENPNQKISKAATLQKSEYGFQIEL